MRDVARFARKRVEFYFTQPITRRDFLDIGHYRAFKKRAEVLGLHVD